MTKIRISLSFEDIVLLLELINEHQAWDCYRDQYLFEDNPDADARRRKIEEYLKAIIAREKKR